jgi:hypothetical protein
MIQNHAKEAVVMLSESPDLIAHSTMFKFSASVFCAIVPPGIVNTATGGRLLAQAFPDLNGLERFGLAGIGLAAAWFFLKLALTSHAKALSDKDAELLRLQRVADEKDKRIRELEDKLLSR